MDVAQASGIDFTFFNDEVPDRFFLPEVMGGGAAWFDYDGDGRLDLYLVNGARLKAPDPAQTEHLNGLYRNRGQGSFTLVTQPAAAHDGGFGQGCAVGDYNADGFDDLYITNFGRNALLHNNGDGTFSDVTAEAGVEDPRWGSSAVWLDIDADGNLDLYVVNYLNVSWDNYKVCEFHGQPGYCGPGQYAGVPDGVYLSQGDGTFREGAELLGLVGEQGKGLAVAVLDFDQDLRAEIYVANDMAPNFLFTRSRPESAGVGVEARGDDGRSYRDVAPMAGCAVSDDGQNEASMGVACADFDNDGLPDIFLTHFFSQKNTLYRHLGNLLFLDDSRRTRVAATSYQTLGFGTVAFDYDLDGDQDLFIANGHVLGPRQQPYAMRPQVLGNDGSGRFDDLSDLAGPYFQQMWLGRGAAGADFDDDGDIDLAVTHLNRPFALLRNDSPAGSHFLGLKLATADRIVPVGARVVVTQGERRWCRPVVAGGSYLSVSDARLLFGFGAVAEPVDVEVYWPSGERDVFPRLAVDGYWRLRAGRPPLRLE